VLAMASTARIKKTLWDAGAGAVVSLSAMAHWTYFEPRTFEWSEPCCICLDRNTFPVRLPCGHVSCGSCMHKLICYNSEDDRETVCPECRQGVTLVELMSQKSVQNALATLPQLEEVSKLHVKEIRHLQKNTDELQTNIDAVQLFLSTLQKRQWGQLQQQQTLQQLHDTAVNDVRKQMNAIL
jgi:hypothetical protein